MLQKDIIRESSSPWAAPVVIEKTKTNSLNSVTQRDTFPLPRMDSILDALSGTTLFSTLDLFSGFWQMTVEERDKKKISFATYKGSYEFNRLPMGCATHQHRFNV